MLAETAELLDGDSARALIAATALAVWTTDAEGAVVADSPTWRAFTGQSVEAYLGWGWLDAIHPDDRARARDGWKQALRSASTLENVFRLYDAAGGDYRWTSVRAVPLLDAEGGVRGWVGMNTDIHALKTTEEALRLADRRKAEFLAVLGHELRNPLAPISTGAAMLEQAAARPELITGIGAMLKRQVDHLARLVDDLLDVSRISQGKLSLRMARVDINEAVSSAIEQLRPLAEACGHELVVELCQRPLWGEADPERLTQVVANLLNNAATYMEPGGTIRVTTAVEAERIVVRVADTGYGIPADRLRELFLLFTRVPEHRDLTTGGGLGVGLGLAHRLVAMHDGTLEAHSEGLGRGSEFVVRLPPLAAADVAPTDPAVPAEAAPTAASSAPAARRVLVVDDNEDSASTLRLLLELKGHHAVAAHDGRAALAAIPALDPDVVLLDIGLPGMDGLEIARRIRSMPDGDRRLIIAVTGWGQSEDRARTAAAGFDLHFTKPLDLQALERVLGAAG